MIDLSALDHTGVVVADLDEAIPFYRDTLGLSLVHRETLAGRNLEAVLFDVGESHVELLMPLDSESTVAKFLAGRGPGLHHVAYRVADIEATLETLISAGVNLIDTVPRSGVRGARVAFLHPSACGGVLTELVEPAGH